jgi:diguanylate cyclase (GGDEF)-like protein
MGASDDIGSRNLPALAPVRARPASSRLGISARLGIAFFAVAVLAAAANFIGEYGGAVVYAPAVPTVSAPPAARAPGPPVPAPVVELKTVDPGGLIAALDRFGRAIRERSEAGTPESTADLRGATQELMRESRAYADEADGSVEPAHLKRLRARVAAHGKSGQDLVKLADERRKVLKEYLDRFEVMDVRMKASVGRALKIFGRVIARQSLIALSGSLDEMRLRVTAFTSAEHYERAAIDAVAASEAAFAARLRQSQRGLERSQGDEWLTQMEADFARIVSLRHSLMSLDDRQRSDKEFFSRENAGLAAMVRTTAYSRAARVTAPAPSAARVSVVAAPAAKVAAPMPAAARQATLSPVPSALARNRRTLVAWITAGVLALVFIMSAVTVMSIVVPVRRLMRVTRSIANGRTHARVPRGGLRELDLLAVAFNQMAEQVADAQAAARHYQGQLEQKVDERTRQLQHLAEHDPLTQLPNRRQLFAFLNAAIERAAASGRHVGVFFLDVDNFKNINDSLGHAFGDRVLRGIAHRLRETVGSAGFAARLGGDEFTVVLEDASGADAVLEAGQALLRAFQKPLPIEEGRDLAISASIGVSLYPQHELDAEALLRAADAALFHAKALGRNQMTLFTRELVEAASSRFTIEQGLRRALEHGEFELVFQPEIDLRTLQPALVEALLRWRQPDGRLAMPAEFLQVAEDSGLIMQVSDWVLESAIEAAARWHHGAWPNARVAINVSSRQLFDNEFVDRVQALLTLHRLPARCIEIELTETVLQTGSSTIAALRRLRELGVAIALDDFGTGYSSIASLEQLPLTRVKLDRCLIASIDTSPRSAAIARSIIGLCRGLDLEVTAEGVERPAQLAMLREQPLYLQGYLLSYPVPENELAAVLAELPQRMESLLLDLPASEASVAEPSVKVRSRTRSA